MGRSRGRRLTPELAAAALTQGQCLYAHTGSACSGPAVPQPLLAEDHTVTVLTCRAHFGRLRRMTDRDLERLGRHLIATFVRPPSERWEG